MIADPIAKEFLKRYERAKAKRTNFVDVFEECYEFALPQRESFTMKFLVKDEMIKFLMRLLL